MFTLRNTFFSKYITRPMSTHSKFSDISVPVNTGLTQLDKSLFTIKNKVWVTLFPDPKNIGNFVKQNRYAILTVPRLQFTVMLDENSIDPELRSKVQIKNKNLKAIALTDELSEESPLESGILKESTLKQIKDYDGTFHEFEIQLGYDHWKAEEILKSVLPNDLINEIPTSFTKTGHIAHLNLRDEYKPYDKLIGQVILDKNASIRTVVDKLDSIDTQFRTFKMKVIAGDDDFLVTQKESDCLFSFDFRKVYWNSRLSTEHGRLIQKFNKGDAICDVMGGVGPFSIPAGKKQCIVFANDLNPESYKYLKKNISQNKVGDFVIPFNEDGRQFIKDSVILLQDHAKENINIKIVKTIHAKQPKKNREVSNATPFSNDANRIVSTKKQAITTISIPTFFSHYIMNLPDSALTFIDSYIGLFSNAFPHLTDEEIKQLPGFKLPMIHVHHFEKFDHLETPVPSHDELYKRIHSKMCELLKFYGLDMHKIEFHLVRMVAPTKPMFCISFELPEEVAFHREN